MNTNCDLESFLNEKIDTITNIIISGIDDRLNPGFCNYYLDRDIKYYRGLMDAYKCVLRHLKYIKQNYKLNKGEK